MQLFLPPESRQAEFLQEQKVKKTEEEAKLFGGAVNEAYDACYHKACDDINNLNIEALEVNTNALAFIALSFGHSTSTIRSVNKLATSNRQRNKVVFPKHLHCNEDVYDM